MAGGLAVCLSPLRTTTACAAGLALGLLLLAVARPPLRPLLQRLAAINFFVLFLWCVTPLTVPGTPVAHWGIFTVSQEGLRLALLVSIKSNAISCIFLALVATLDASTAGHALESLHCPPKLVFLFLFTIRYIHGIAQEWHTLLVAARLRGFSPRTNMHTYRTLASLLGLLLVRSYERALRVQEAMALRGFSGHFRSIAVFRAHRGDALFAVSLLLCMAGLVVIEYCAA